jgi:hypothetical protein
MMLQRDNPPSQEALDPDPDPSCAACGCRLRYRGRRGKTTIWECEESGCPVVLQEIHDPGAEPARSRRGHRP